jgi:hypothetical protein
VDVGSGLDVRRGGLFLDIGEPMNNEVNTDTLDAGLGS